MKTAHLASALILGVVILAGPTGARAESGGLLGTIWDYPGRTFAAVDNMVYGIFGWTKKIPDENQAVSLEDLVGQPVIEIVQPEPVDLTSKIDSTGEALDRMYLGYQLVVGEAVLVGYNWDNLTVADVAQSTEKLNAILEGIKQLDWLTQSWGWEQLDAIAVQENLVRSDLVTLRSIVTTSGMLPVAYSELKSAVENLGVIQKLIGEKTDAADSQTLYGQYQQVRELAGEWDGLQSQPLEAKILALNRISGVDQILSFQGKNRVLGLMALAQANKTLLVANRGAAIATTWLEEDPLVFKTLVSNSSPLARREIAVKYYLPREVREQDILSPDPNLQVRFDPDRHQYFAEGDLTIAAGDTRVAAIKISDLWQFDQGQVDRIRIQTSELVGSLEGGKAFVDGVALKSDIEVALAKIGDLQARAVTPDQRIAAFRQANSELAVASEKLGQIRHLVVKQGAAGNSWNVVRWGGGFVALGAGLSLAAWGVIVYVRRHVRGKAKAWRPMPSVKRFNVFSNRIASSDL